MESASPNLSVPSGKTLSTSRIVTLLGSILVTLSSGTHYMYSAYAPQLAARLRISQTQLNVVGLAAYVGVYASGPVWGRIVDHKGQQIPLIAASFCLFVGYLGMKQMYDYGTGDGATVSALHFALLVACASMIGFGGSAGIVASLNATARSFPPSSRATTTSLVLSGVGLSALWFSLLMQMLSPGDISISLLLLALGTAIPVLVGAFIVRPIPLPPTSRTTRREITTEFYDPIPGEDFTGESQVALYSEADVESTPLLHNRSSCQGSIVPSAVESNPPINPYRERSVGYEDELPDIHGRQLWSNSDFYLIFVIMGLCGGTAIMYINNVGSISQMLYAATHTVYDDVEVTKWQATQVSILSLGNFAGRVLIGLISDSLHTHFHLPRAYSLCIVSSLFVISQATAVVVSSIETLWIVTFSLGLAYGSMVGSSPVIVIEWFGLAHFSENSGFMTFAPLIGGNLFSLMFGHNLDVHVPVQDPHSLTKTHSLLLRLKSHESPSELQCFEGKQCYLESLQVTLVVCIVSLGLSWWAGMRESQKLKRRNVC